MDEEKKDAGKKIAYSWQCDGFSGQWINPKEIMLQLMPWQYYVGTKVEKSTEGDLVIVRVGLKPHTDQAVRYLEMEREAGERAKKDGREK